METLITIANYLAVITVIAGLLVILYALVAGTITNIKNRIKAKKVEEDEKILTEMITNFIKNEIEKEEKKPEKTVKKASKKKKTE